MRAAGTLLDLVTKCTCKHLSGSHTGSRGKCNVRGCACRRHFAWAVMRTPDVLVPCACGHVSGRHGLFRGTAMEGGCEVVEWKVREGGRSGEVKCGCPHFASRPRAATE